MGSPQLGGTRLRFPELSPWKREDKAGNGNGRYRSWAAVCIFIPFEK